VLTSAVVAPLCWTLSIFPMERVKVEQQAVGAAKEGVGRTIGTSRLVVVFLSHPYHTVARARCVEVRKLFWAEAVQLMTYI
jgi:hypothetical protein